MTTEPDLLLAVDRGVTWPDSRGTLRRVPGPHLDVPEGESLTWFDPLDGRPQVTSVVEPGPLPTFATAVEWPEDYPKGLSGAAVYVGDASAVRVWHADGRAFSVDRGLGCLVLSSHLEQVAVQLRDVPEVLAVLAAVLESTVHPLSIGGDIVGLAFQCGMAASTNHLFTGRDEVADLEPLDGEEIAT